MHLLFLHRWQIDSHRGAESFRMSSDFSVVDKASVAAIMFPVYRLHSGIQSMEAAPVERHAGGSGLA
jgi:hypothetical protein